MATNDKEHTSLNGILASLHYLSREAERAELPDISEIIRNAIIAISVSEDGARDPLERNRSLASQGTCTVLEFFDHYLRASPGAREAFLKSLGEGIGAA